jgi:NADPH:quinone reductase-like Zn-dependent oxidoreductase
MKKVVYQRYGSVSDLEIAEVAIPKVQPDELLIKVKAVSINPVDWKRLEGQLKMMTGSKFPKGIAIDFAGVIEKMGTDVSNFEEADAVFGALDAMKGEALSEYIVVKAQTVCKKPVGVSFETAAASVTAVVTALYLMKKCNVQSGDHLLINGAAGSVGMALLQMAVSKGIKVTAMASGDGLAFIQRWKPEVLLDYKKHNVLEQKAIYNAVVELSGNLPFSKGKALLTPQAVFASTLPNPIDMLKAFLNNLFSKKKFHIIMANPTPQHLHQVNEWLTQKGLEVPIAKQFVFADFKEAYLFARKGQTVGKVVISMA